MTLPTPGTNRILGYPAGSTIQTAPVTELNAPTVSLSEEIGRSLEATISDLDPRAAGVELYLDGTSTPATLVATSPWFSIDPYSTGDLGEGVTRYARARAFVDMPGGRVYSDYSSTVSASTQAAEGGEMVTAVLGTPIPVSPSSIRVPLAAPPQNFTAFALTRSTSENGTYTAIAGVDSVSDFDDGGYLDTGRSASTTYWYRTTQHDGGTPVLSNKVSGTTQAASGLSAPGVSGAIAADASITISALSGEAFGATGPDIVLFDDFRAQTLNTVHDGNSVVGGPWHIQNGPVVANPQMPGGRALDSYNGGMKTGEFHFPNTDTILASWYFQFPPGKHPIDMGDSAGQIKFSWLLHANSSNSIPEEPDLNLGGISYYPPTGKWQERTIFSNDAGVSVPWDQNFGFGVQGNAGGDIAHNDVVRMMIWLRRSSGVQGNTMRQFLRCGNGITLNSQGARQIFGTNNTVFTWTRLKVPVYTQGQGNCGMQQGGFYFARGAGAAARVEIGDNATYGNCKELSLCTPTSWSNGSITLNVRPGRITNLSGKYLHIHNANNVHTAGGVGRLIS